LKDSYFAGYFNFNPQRILSCINHSKMPLSETAFTIKDNTGNPALMGLLVFGMTTVLLNLHNAGLYDLNSMIIGMGIFTGGIMPIIAGIHEWKKNNTFGATAFTAYGSFWISHRPTAGDTHIALFFTHKKHPKCCVQLLGCSSDFPTGLFISGNARKKSNGVIK
jgi:succinate-acetate transporter protein